MIDDLEWVDSPDTAAREIMALLVNVDDEKALAPFVIHAQVASLPFYRAWKLVKIRSSYRKARRVTPMEDVYALWHPGRSPHLLDGASAPIHDVNDDEGLELDASLAAAYIRFFLFAMRADGEPFILFEAAPDKVPAKLRAAAREAQPLTPAGTDGRGRWLFDAAVAFQGSLFHARLALASDGQVEMIDDDPLMAEFPAGLVTPPPVLGLGPKLRAQLTSISAVRASSAPLRVPRGRPASRARPPASSRPTIIEMVELLLERALRDQAKNRLLGYFNATLPAANELQRFATLMANASPVVIVETKIPFVEETIAEIVTGLAPPNVALPLYRGSVGIDGNGQEVLESFSLPSQGPAVVLIPMRVYRRVAQVERLAFDIAAGDLAAIITCDKSTDLPEPLRRHTDLVLRLPTIDEETFETLFERVIGGTPTKGWRKGGTAWVKHLLHTDFEHPRRMRLPRTEALDFIRGQVTERLVAVDPGQSLGLADLHGLGEARQFAEDLIADIHAAIAGQLPWAQVDRGALLVGAPGTGKTTLARAIAKDCGVKFIQASASTWMAEGVSLGPHIQAIRRTFDEARDYAPSILFIDEIDSIGNRERFAEDKNSLYQTEVVNAVLEQMQGLDPAAPVFVIGATNHENMVDPALRRSGRMDRVIRIPRPNSDSLDHIYRHYLGALGSGIAIGKDVDTRALGRLSVGLTGADVERIVRGASRRARKARRSMSQTDLMDEVTNKPRGTGELLRLTAADLERTAVHEAGHALAMFLSASKGADIGFVSIVPRDDGTLGFVAPFPDERVHLTRRDYEEQLDVFLAGRAAEELKYGPDEISSGAGQDLQHATELVSRMVTKLGLGHGRGLLWSETMTAADLELAEGTLARSYERILGKLKAKEAKLAHLAAELVARQELPGDEVRAMLSGRYSRTARATSGGRP